MQPLDVVVLVTQLLGILVSLAAAGVGVWVLIRTARVSALESEVADLAGLLRKRQAREARASSSGRRKTNVEQPDSQDDTLQDVASMTSEQIQAKKDEIYRGYARGALG